MPRSGASAGLTTALAFLLVLPATTPATAAGAASRPAALPGEPSTADVRWYAPVIAGGKVFPVLRSGERWLNWRDTYGAPRMRLEPDGVWRQVGVHQGIDVYAEKGAPVVSMGAGTVEQVGWTFYSGWRVGVRGADDRYYFYAHLSAFSPGIAVGRRLAAGTMLGRVGNSGYGPEGTADEFPPHLHFGLQTGQRWDNPQDRLLTLYRAYVDHTRNVGAGMRALAERRRRLGVRAFSAAPAGEALRQAIDALGNERSRLESALYVNA
ncbi:MAG: M23 family metallopeptidase [Actinomycetota bacterium]